MKKLLSAAFALTLLLGGCQAGFQQRGLDAQGAYVSTSRPAIQVAVPGLPWKAGGFSSGRLYDANMAGGLVLDVRSHVYAAGPQGPEASVTHAELPAGWIWTTVHPRPGAVNEGMEVFGGKGWTAFTYLVPRRTDPFAGTAGEPVDAGEDGAPCYWLARYCALVCNYRLTKIILEYREPAPEGMTGLSPLPFGQEGFVKGFEERARKAFQVMAPAPAAPVQQGGMGGIRWQFMDDRFLGDVMEQDVRSLSGW